MRCDTNIQQIRILQPQLSCHLVRSNRQIPDDAHSKFVGAAFIQGVSNGVAFRQCVNLALIQPEHAQYLSTGGGSAKAGIPDRLKQIPSSHATAAI